MTRLIDADKLYPDRLTKQGNLAISQSQIANAPTVELTSDIRWTDKLSVIANGDIIDFYGRVLGHINLEIMKGCDAVEPVEDKQTCDNCGQDHKYCEPTNKEQFGFCGKWAEHQ